MKKRASVAVKSKPRNQKIARTDEAALRRIPKQVELFLKDLQQQMQSGAIDLTDWRSLGVGILNRMSQVSATLRTAAVPAAKPLARAGALSRRSPGRRKVVKKSLVKNKSKKAKRH